jgi:hypothetical protein
MIAGALAGAASLGLMISPSLMLREKLAASRFLIPIVLLIAAVIGSI